MTAGLAGWRLPEPLSREVVIADGTGGLVAGGLRPGDRSTDRVYRVQVDRGVTVQLPPLRQSLHDSAGASVGGTPYVVGGGSASELDTVQQLRSGSGWRLVGRLPGARSDLSVVAVPDGLLVIGGYDGQRATRQVLLTRDGRTFHPYAELGQAVRYAAVAVTGGAVFVFGGEDQQRQLRTVQRIDLGSHRVTQLEPLPIPLGHAAAAALGDRILLLGGRTGPSRISDTIWSCAPASGACTRAGRLPYAVADAGLLALPAAAYLLGGETPNWTDRVLRIQLRP